MRKLPTVSEMEHITSKEFGENMDAILERVAKENIALIIDHADKSYVLCPARWFEVPELTQLEVMVKNAVRYVSEVDDSDLAETASHPVQKFHTKFLHTKKRPVCPRAADMPGMLSFPGRSSSAASQPQGSPTLRSVHSGTRFLWRWPPASADSNSHPLSYPAKCSR